MVHNCWVSYYARQGALMQNAKYTAVYPSLLRSPYEHVICQLQKMIDHLVFNQTSQDNLFPHKYKFVIFGASIGSCVVFHGRISVYVYCSRLQWRKIVYHCVCHTTKTFNVCSLKNDWSPASVARAWCVRTTRNNTNIETEKNENQNTSSTLSSLYCECVVQVSISLRH